MLRLPPSVRRTSLAALCLLGTPWALAQSAPSARAATPSAPALVASAADEDENLVESARESVRSATEWLARGVDSWFGDMPFEQGGKVTDGRLSLSLLKRQHEGVDVSLRFNARVRLPNVERRAYLFIGRDNAREVITDKPGAFSRPQQLLPERADERRVFAGIGIDLRDRLDFRLGFRGGLKPYAQVRWRQPWQIDEASRLEFRETVFWSVDDHLGSTTALSYERALSPVLAARWLAAGTVTQVDRTLEWSSLVGLHRSVGAQRLLSLEALVNGRLDSGIGASDYGVQTRWEQPVYEDWLLGELIVGHFWPRKDAETERVRAWALGVQVKMKF